MTAVLRRLCVLAVGAIVMLAACGSTEDAPTATRNASVMPSTPLVSPSARASAEQHEQSTSSAPGTTSPSTGWSAELVPDTIVRAVVDGVTLRAGPGLDVKSRGTLRAGSRSFVVGEPTVADGYEWVMLSGPGLPPASGCATFPDPELSCPVWFGWAATGDPATRTAWFAPDPSDCPDPSSETEALMTLGDVEALACYGDREIEFTAWLPPGGLNEPIGCPTLSGRLNWLTCPGDHVATVYASPDSAAYLELHAETGSDADFTRDGYWAIVVGHLDDPASEDCDDEIYPGHPIPGGSAVLECRANFVVTLHGAVAP
jgi:hypothetical protein